MTLTAARYLSERLTGDKGLVATFNPLPDCVFLRPIILDESAEKQSIQLSVSRSANANTSNGVSSSLFARSRKGAKVEYAKCVVLQTDVAAVTAGWSSQAAQNGAGHRLSPPLFYALFSQIVDYSNDYRRISQVSISKNFDEAYAEILVAMNAHGVLGSSSTLQRSRGA